MNTGDNSTQICSAPPMSVDQLAAFRNDDHNPPEVFGVDTIDCPEAALEAADQAIQKFPKVARFHAQKGRSLYVLKRYDEARESLEVAVALGHGEAIFALWTMHSTSRYSKAPFPDSEKFFAYEDMCRKYFSSLDPEQYPAALVTLAVIEDDDFKRLELWEKAAALGSAEGMLSAGRSYMPSEYDEYPDDEDKALDYLKAARDKGEFEALSLMATLLKSRDLDCYDLDAAIQCLVDYADHRETYGLVEAAELCAKDAYDLDRAESLILSAIAEGHKDARKDLAWLYEDNQTHFGSAAQQRIVSIYMTLAEDGDTGAMTSLAHLYLEGSGVEKNTKSARYWYERAAKRGDKSAMVALARYLASGEFGETDVYDAVRWLENCIEAGGDHLWSPHYQIVEILEEEGSHDGKKIAGHLLRSLIKSESRATTFEVEVLMARFRPRLSKNTVMSLQNTLRQEGFYDGIIDGEWDDARREALKNYVTVNK